MALSVLLFIIFIIFFLLGLELAKLSALPAELLHEAEKLSKNLTEQKKVIILILQQLLTDKIHNGYDGVEIASAKITAILYSIQSRRLK